MACYADQVLHLFRVVGSDVVRILTADVFYAQVDEDNPAEEGTRIDDSVGDDRGLTCSAFGKVFPPKGQSAVFRMLPTQTNGFYDIARTLKGMPQLIFRWNGTRYVLDGKDPVNHRLRDERGECKDSLGEWHDKPRPAGESSQKTPAPGADSATPPASSPNRAVLLLDLTLIDTTLRNAVFTSDCDARTF